MTFEALEHRRKMAPWVSELIGRYDAVPTPSGAMIDVGESKVVITPDNLRVPGPIDPSLLLPCVDTWFDLRDWLELVDGSDHTSLRGKAQVDHLDRLAEFASLQSRETLIELRRARDRRVVSEGLRAIHGPAPTWPEAVKPPGWVRSLDELLVAEGFDSGWSLDAGPGWPIGVVRQRGPLRIQVSVFNNEPLVQVAAWPRAGWVPMASIAEYFDLNSQPEAAPKILTLAERACDSFFSTLEAPMAPRRPHFGSGDLDPEGRGTGPGGLFEYALISGALQDSWIDLPDYNEMRVARTQPDNYLGGPWFTGSLKHGKNLAKLPPILRSYSGGHWWSHNALPVLNRVAPDATLFEIDVEGIPYYHPTFPRTSKSIAPNRKLSKGRRGGDPVHGGMVIDPRSVARPGTGNVKVEHFLVDRRAMQTIGELAPALELYPTWDPHEELKRISIRRYLTQQPDPEPEPFQIRGPRPEADHPGPATVAANVRAADDSHATNQTFQGAVEWFASRRDWDGLDTFLDLTGDLVLEPAHQELIRSEAFADFADEANEMFDEAIDQANYANDVKALAVGHYYDGNPDGRITTYLCFKDETTDADWPAYFNTDINGPLLHDLLSPWFEIYANDPAAGNAGYALTYSRLVGTLGRLWKPHQELPIPAAVVDDKDRLTYL